MRDKSLKRRGVAVSGRPLEPLGVMLSNFTDKSSPLWHDMLFYKGVIELCYTENEIVFMKYKLGIYNEIRRVIKRHKRRLN
jgi:hypothetical protein